MTKSGFDRRTALKAAAAGLTLGGLYHTRAGAQEAETPMQTDDAPGAPGWRRFTVGEASVTPILDGVRPGDGPHPIFGEDQSAEDVQALMEENGLPPSQFVNFFHPTVIRLGDETVLIDTGFGAGGRANGQGLLTQRMQAAGVEPGDVTTVFLTHLHGDHIGGLLEGDSPAFPNAEIVLGRIEHEFWTSDAARNGPAAGNAEAVAANLGPLEDGLRLIEDGESIVPGLTARAAFGHTPGMMVLDLISGEDRMMFTADVFGQFVVSFQRPDWHVRFDMDKQAAAETRRRLLAELSGTGVPICGYHLPFPAVGTVEMVGGDDRFVPESYRLML